MELLYHDEYFGFEDDGRDCNAEEIFNDLSGAIIDAVREGDLDFLKTVKQNERESFYNCIRLEGSRLLCDATLAQEYEVADFLLSNGCFTDRVDLKLQTTALHYAARNPQASYFIETLLLHLANVNVKNAKGFTPLHFACAVGAVQNVDVLLRYGACYNARNNFKKTPLHVATAAGHVDCIQLLLKFGADVSPSDSVEYTHLTPLDIAVIYFFQALGHSNVCKALHAFIKWDKTLIENTCRELMCPGDLNNSTSDETPPVYLSKLEIMDVLIQAGAKFNVLLAVVKYLRADLFPLAMRTLIEEHGVNVNVYDDLFFTPLHFIVTKYSREIAKYFIDHGADVNALSYNMQSPLTVALIKKDNNDVVKLLAENRAVVNCIFRGHNALATVLLQGNISLAQFLLDSGADPNLKDPRAPGFTALMHLLRQRPCNYFAVKCLLEHGVDVNIRDSTLLGSTALHMAANCRRNEEDEGIKILTLLLKFVDNINVQDFYGYTPLMRAVLLPNPSLKIIQLLLDSNADVNSVSFDGNTVLHLVIRNSKADVLNLIMLSEHYFNVKELFNDRGVLIQAISMNLPYRREELLSIRNFYIRPDIDKKRRELVERFVHNNWGRCSQGFFERVNCVLNELLRRGTAERRCLSLIYSASSVLFFYAEEYVLKRRAIKTVNESQLRGVLEYRMVFGDGGETCMAACNDEMQAMKADYITKSVTVADIFSSSQRQLHKYLKREDVHTVLSNGDDGVVSDCKYPIFISALKSHIDDGLARIELLNAASSSLNCVFLDCCLPSEGKPLLRSSRRCMAFPTLASAIILSYLSSNDLKNLIIAQCLVSTETTTNLKKTWETKVKEIFDAANNCLV